MEPKELKQLVDEFADAVRQDLEYKLELADLESVCAAAKASVLFLAESGGLINGKNADSRKRQQADILSHSADVKTAEDAVLEWKRNVIEAQAWRAKLEARVSLTKAWLYSQARIG